MGDLALVPTEKRAPPGIWIDLLDEVAGAIFLGIAEVADHGFTLVVSTEGLAIGEGPIPASAIGLRSGPVWDEPTIVAEGRFEFSITRQPFVHDDVLSLGIAPLVDLPGRTIELGLRVGKVVAPLGRWRFEDLPDLLTVSMPGQTAGPVPLSALSVRII